MGLGRRGHDCHLPDQRLLCLYVCCPADAGTGKRRSICLGRRGTYLGLRVVIVFADALLLHCSISKFGLGQNQGGGACIALPSFGQRFDEGSMCEHFVGHSVDGFL